eukprot:2511820-Pleurochrysis_carterae.AAC.1
MEGRWRVRALEEGELARERARPWRRRAAVSVCEQGRCRWGDAGVERAACQLHETDSLPASVPCSGGDAE